MVDNIAGHTAAQNTLGEDGLRDGDSLSPTTLTNIIQGVQGNGVLRYQDGAYGSTRNATNTGDQPGSMIRAANSTLTVSGGFVVLDGAVYEFGGGVGNTATLDLNNGSHGTGALTLAANQEAIYTIFVAPSGGNNKVHYEGGSPVDTTTGLYASAPNQYLIDYDTGVSHDNDKTIVLALVRVQYVASGGGSNNLNIIEINDKRVFVEGAADYRVPLSVGTITSGEIVDGGAEGINTIAHLNALHNDNGDLAITDTINVHWVSHPRYGTFAQTPPGGSDAGYGQGPSRGLDRGGGHVADSFYFAGRNNQQTGHYSVRLQGMGVDATTTALTTNGTWVVTSDGDSFFMLAPNAGVDITLQPEKDGTNYKFPEGHIIEVCNNGLGNIIFDDLSGSNETVGPTHRATFIYEGSVWVRCDYQSAIISGSAIAAIYDNSGTPAFTSGITKTEVQALLNVGDGATITDAANVTAAGALMDSEVTNLAQVKAFDETDYATAAQGAKADSAQQPPSEGAFVNGDKTKLDAIEASADVTDTANVTTAGALMDSEVTNLAQVKAFDETDYATAAQGTKADTAHGWGNHASAGYSTTTGTVTGVTGTSPIASSGGATPAISITAATTSAAGSMSAADKTKLDGITASADVTDATTVNAAGAIMHSDLGTKGDLVVGDGAGDATILGVGTNNHVLTADSSEASGVKWAATAAAGITALTGDVTASGSGSVAATIAADAVTYAKIQNVAANNVLLGNDNGAGTLVQELDATAVRAILNVADGSTEYTDAMAQAANAPAITGNTIAATANTLAIAGVTAKASKFFAYLSGNQSYGSGAIQITHDLTLWNVGSDFSTTNNEYTAPRDGYYLVACSYYTTTSVSWSMSNIQVSPVGGGGYAIRLRRGSANGADTQISAVIKLDAGDKVAHFAHAASSTDIGAALNTLTYFQITEML
jgi:hypothetical protein